MNFAELIRSKRLDKKISLRTFCIDLEIDPVRWSKIERRRIAPTQSRRLIAKIANYLNLDFFLLVALAEKDKGIRFKPLSDKELVKKLPCFGLKNKSKKEILKFIEVMRASI